jgi:hypothetical protein
LWIKKLVSIQNANLYFSILGLQKNEYPKQYCYPSRVIDKSIEKRCCSPTLENLEQETRLINESYDLVAQKNNLLKSDRMEINYEVLTKHPK